MPTVSVVELDENGNEIEGKVEQFQVDEGEILFDALDNKGKKLPHGCLAGSCGSCRINIVEGEKNVSPPSLIERNTIQNLEKDYKAKKGDAFMEGKNIRLSCRMKVNGDIKVGPLKG